MDYFRQILPFCLLQKAFHQDLTKFYGSFLASQLTEPSTHTNLLGLRPELSFDYQLPNVLGFIPLEKWGHKLHFTHAFDKTESITSGEDTRTLVWNTRFFHGEFSSCTTSTNRKSVYKKNGMVYKWWELGLWLPFSPLLYTYTHPSSATVWFSVSTETN